MTPDEIIAALKRVSPRVPEEALRAAGEHRAELTPRLLASLVELTIHPADSAADVEWELPFYAMYLLASWREHLAHPLLLAFLRLPGEQCLDLLGDIMTEDMDRLLAQTAGGDTRGIVALVRDPAVNEWARTAAIRALGMLAAWGELPRDVLIAQYRDLIASCGETVDADDPGPVVSTFVTCALDLQLVEMRDELLGLMDRGWVDEDMIGDREHIAAQFGLPPRVPPRPPIVDVAEAVKWWGCFKRERPARPEPSLADALPQPYRAPPKVGRNDPCPCGSGKKYKKCCGA